MSAAEPLVASADSKLMFLSEPQKIELIQNITHENDELREQIKKDKENLRHRILELSVLYDTSNSLSYSLNYEEIVKIIMDALYKVLDFEVCAILLVDFNSGTELITRLSCALPEEIILTVQNNVIAALTPFIGKPLERKDIIFNTLRQFDNEPRNRLVESTETSDAPEQIKSFFNVPLIFKNQVLGIINVCSTQRHAFNQDEVTFLYTMANQLSSTLGRLKLIIASEKSKISTMIESMSDGIIMTDENNQLSVINPAAKRLLGFSSEQNVTSRDLHECFNQINLFGVFNEVYSSLKSIFNRDAIVAERFLSASLAPVTDLNKKLVGVVTVIRDITEMKKADKIKTDRLASIHESRKIISSIHNLDKLLDETLDFLIRVSGAEHCSILLKEENFDRYKCAAHRKLPEKVRKTFRYATGETIMEQALRSMETVFIKDFDKNPKIDTEAAKIPIHTYICIPLLVKTGVMGVINLLIKITETSTRTTMNEDELDTLETIAGLMGSAIENATLYQQTLKQQQTHQELKIATDIQAKLLPEKLPELSNYTFGAISVSARAVGGDYYDAFMLSNGDVGLLICDIVGKGVPAALVMVMIKSIFITYAHMIPSPLDLFDRVNKVLCNDLTVDKYVPLFYAVLDPKTNRLRYSNAGHEPAYLYQAATDSFLKLDTEGFPVGAMEDTVFEEKQLQLAQDDIFVMFTDGIIEARNKAGEEYKLSRLQDTIRSHREKPAKRLVDEIYISVLNFSEDTPQHDDLTLLIAKAGNNEVDSDSYLAVKELRVMSGHENVKKVRDQIQRICEQLGFKSGMIHDIKLAVNEAHANIIEHAYGGKPNGEIIFRFFIFRDRLEVLIKDFGKTASYDTIRTDHDMEGLEGSGLGVYLIRELMDDVEYKISPKVGTEVTLTKYLSAEAKAQKKKRS